ncbi:MAG TPA: glycoside hydrolase family 15 protein [Acetobacteraceae bacterium]|nr:glycoside hydrolase family 15 protein [Acetobacteraceae bacterium]
MTDAPGKPGIPPRWTSSAKSGIGTGLAFASRVWFTLSHGILNEIYYPRVDQACTRDFGLLLAGPDGFFAEEKRDCAFEVATLEDGVPAFTLTNTHKDGRFRVIKRIIADPRHDVVLQEIRVAPEGSPLDVFALLAPHLVNGGAHNTAWLGDYKGQDMLFARGDGTVLALGSDRAFLARSVGYAGVSDGWQLVRNTGRLAAYERAEDGNVALTAQLTIEPDMPTRLALGFGRSEAEAAFRVRASLQRPFAQAEEEYAADWREWQARLRSLDRRVNGRNTYRISTGVLRCHESPTFPGGLIASLSIPWGFAKGDDDMGGYHLVWPRDLVETAGGFLACGAPHEARRVLRYLRATQEADGSWPQNCWLDGSPYWRGLQLDECAFPILLVDLAWRTGALARPELQDFWPMVRKAAGFVLQRGPVTRQDRWEENAGYTPFTLAVEIAALVAAAEIAEAVEDGAAPGVLRDTADAWNAMIEDWLYVSGTQLARDCGVEGYYVRVAPNYDSEARAAPFEDVEVRNRPGDSGRLPADLLVSPDALALVRFGLRAPDDPRIRNTIVVIDHLLKADLPPGPVWRRYNGDGYGECADGSPFRGCGIGRAWPLLTGERAHYELAAGRRAEAERLLATMEACASEGGLLPEQVWDAAPIPGRELYPGRPSGSAMPLVWAHAEHLKLIRSLADGAVFDLPPQTHARYVRRGQTPRCLPWRPDWRSETMPAGRALRIDLPEPATVHWSTDGWTTVQDTPTAGTGLGTEVCELPTEALPAGATVLFTWRRRSGEWAGRDYAVQTR